LATHIIVLNEIAHPEHRQNGWRLCLQWARYQYDHGTEPETGFRFIWRRPDGSLQPARGQVRIPSLANAELLNRARHRLMNPLPRGAILAQIWQLPTGRR
jgi:hypothetical protein